MVQGKERGKLKMTKREKEVLSRMKDEAVQEYVSYARNNEDPPADVRTRAITLMDVFEALNEVGA